MSRRLLVAMGCVIVGLTIYFFVGLIIVSAGVAIGLFALADRTGLIPDTEPDSSRLGLESELPPSASPRPGVAKRPSQHVPPSPVAVTRTPTSLSQR